ncbi:hypothetical protein [Sunxiuqinia rutila]|uniref:hypothetical protein n=1 Tax=Sunxiuqinia rutila TaxID=1397841 RepID=UPI003D36E262
MHSAKFFPLTTFVTTYAIAHLVVDAACAFLFIGVLEFSEHIVFSMLLYNALAFVLQAPFGLLIDKKLNPKLASILGLLLVALSFLFWNRSYVALSIISIGNALFHVGGGSLVLSLRKKKATFSGVYVAPGGIGLALGSFLAISKPGTNLVLFPLILLILSFLLYFIKTPGFNRTRKEQSLSNYGVLLVALIMIPIAVRSLIGLSMEFPWKENQYWLWGLIAALALGKVFGGVLADRFGLLKVGVGGLLVSTPLLAFFSTVPLLGLAGGFVFNFTMPVTLIAILSVMPQNKGLSFGLTTVALFIGAIPTILGTNSWLKDDLVVFAFIMLSALVLYGVLSFYGSIKTLKV